MGRQDAGDTDAASLRAFTRHLLADLRALELMLRNGILETGVRRIGAEQEMFLLDRHFRPAPLAVPMMEKLRADGHFTTEVAKFNVLDAKTWNHPVIVRDVLLVRNGEEMAAFRLTLAGR